MYDIIICGVFVCIGEFVMGAVGSNKQTETYWDFKDNKDLSDNINGDKYKATDYWREHTELSNAGEWEDKLLKTAEKDALEHWVGSGYYDMSALYAYQWDDMDDWEKEIASNMYNGINKFELKKGITVNRGTSFRIFGGGSKMTAGQIRNYLDKNTKDGVLQSDGFMSFSTRADGVPVAGKGLVIHMDVPPNKGFGAYVSGIGGNHGEREYITNNNAIIKFDSKSITTDKKGNIHINAKMLGTAKMQSFDSKNKSGYDSARTIEDKKKQKT